MPRYIFHSWERWLKKINEPLERTRQHPPILAHPAHPAPKRGRGVRGEGEISPANTRQHTHTHANTRPGKRIHQPHVFMQVVCAASTGMDWVLFWTTYFPVAVTCISACLALWNIAQSLESLNRNRRDFGTNVLPLVSTLREIKEEIKQHTAVMSLARRCQ